LVPGEVTSWLRSKHGIVTTPINVEGEFRGVRVTPNVYTMPEEIDRFLEAALEAATRGIA